MAIQKNVARSLLLICRSIVTIHFIEDRGIHSDSRSASHNEATHSRSSNITNNCPMTNEFFFWVTKKTFRFRMLTESSIFHMETLFPVTEEPWVAQQYFYHIHTKCATHVRRTISREEKYDLCVKMFGNLNNFSIKI